MTAFCCHKPAPHALEAAAAKEEREGPYGHALHCAPLHTPSSVRLRHEANDCTFNDDFSGALRRYNDLLEAEPWFSQGYVHRAITLLQRGWRGDALCALRDAETSIALSPTWAKAYETRVRCLKDLGQVRPRRCYSLCVSAACFKLTAQSMG